MTSTQRQVAYSLFLLLTFGFFATQPALAADIFASGKAAIKESAGKGSAVETAILSSGLVGATVTGFMTRDWLGAVGGFFGGNILWTVAGPLVGLA